MNISVVDLIIIGAAVVVFPLPLLIGYFGYGSPNQHRPFLKKTVIGIAGLQLVFLIDYSWPFLTGVKSAVFIKWIVFHMFFCVLMWVCFGIGYGLAALRYRIKTRFRQ
jgi:hypothetical protein